MKLSVNQRVLYTRDKVLGNQRVLFTTDEEFLSKSSIYYRQSLRVIKYFYWKETKLLDKPWVLFTTDEAFS